MPGLNLSDILIEVPKWVFAFLAIVVSIVIIYSMFFSSCTTFLFGLEFGSNKNCDGYNGNRLITQIVTKELISDLTTSTTNEWSANLAELDFQPTSDKTKLLISANGSLYSTSTGSDPHNSCIVGLFLENEMITASGTSFLNQTNSHVIPFNMEGEYISLDLSKKTFSLRLWQRRQTKCILQYNTDHLGPGLFKIVEISDDKQPFLVQGN